MIRTRRRHFALVAALMLALAPLATACSGGGGNEAAGAGSSSRTVQAPGVPVRVDSIRRMDLDVLVTAPGRTEALRQDHVRAPFASQLVALAVTDGDQVRAGEVVAQVVSMDSEAALEGAREMLATASSAADSADADTAIAVARRQLVRRPLHAPADGVVLSHGAEVGDYLNDGEVLLTIAESGTVFFDAQVTQGDLAQVSPGELATIDIPALGPTPVGAVVHGILPTASSQDLTAPVRLDFRPRRPNLPVGLFGTVSIVAGHHRNATVVPPAAVLRNDVSGVSRVAVVGPGDIAHWVVVKVGIRRQGEVEIVSPPLPAGQLVITDGQVGLPDSARVSIQP